MNTTERLIRYYNTYNRRETIKDERTRQYAFASLQRMIGPWLPQDRSSRILDIGCGEGTLLAFLREKNFTCLEGFDLSPENVALCHELGLGFVQQYDALQLNEYPADDLDLIFAFDILEHVPKQQAAEFLERIRERLVVGGALILQTPNGGSIYGPFIRYSDLSHEFCLTEKSIVDLLQLAGFDLQDVEVVPAWSAITPLGRLRELHLRVVHGLLFSGRDSMRPRIPTMNMLVRARRSRANPFSKEGGFSTANPLQ